MIFILPPNPFNEDKNDDDYDDYDDGNKKLFGKREKERKKER